MLTLLGYTVQHTPLSAHTVESTPLYQLILSQEHKSTQNPYGTLQELFYTYVFPRYHGVLAMCQNLRENMYY